MKVQDATRKLFVKTRADSKTRATPASNPNTTPVMERNSRVNILQDSGTFMITSCAGPPPSCLYDMDVLYVTLFIMTVAVGFVFVSTALLSLDEALFLIYLSSLSLLSYAVLLSFYEVVILLYVLLFLLYALSLSSYPVLSLLR